MQFPSPVSIQWLAEFIDAKIIGNTKSFVLNDTLFFDTVYHLNKKGRAIRTKQLINLLGFLKKK